MEEDKGYTIHDKRGLFRDDLNEEKDTKGQEGRQSSTEDSGKSNDFVELGFSTFVLSLSTSALVHLAELPDPISNEKKINLPLAKQTIAIIEMLQEKTKGNLTEGESQLIEDLLYDLRLKYIEAAK
ncbi:MAG TPA: DUF1844 domain-containing protein [Deltaproteobacteria bacterium]|nr:DUF1844 domain-containing protein [Deltaproteobacteria bacterium]